ncbi:transmembrane emp24 domain-containing protein 9-like [Odontesthes bonariensis]|uniref:transmembrane emp24 domain-containing protein 9-like n=1 Tax=Odontesthes bonariensis TaxID=219752 RepID=UPI003F588E09
MASGRALRFVSTVFMLNFCCSSVTSLYFHLAEGEQKCFMESIPYGTLVKGDYWTQLYDEEEEELSAATQDLSMHVTVKAPKDQLVLSQQNGSKGRFRFTSSRYGEHWICLRPNSLERPLSAGRMLAVHLNIRAGERANNYTEIQSRNRITTMLQLSVRRLYEQVQQIQSELDYDVIRRERFRTVNHNTNMWIFWWPVVRSIYVVLFIMFLTGSW